MLRGGPTHTCACSTLNGTCCRIWVLNFCRTPSERMAGLDAAACRSAAPQQQNQASAQSPKKKCLLLSLAAAAHDLDATGSAAGSTHTGLRWLHADLMYRQQLLSTGVTALLATQCTWVCQDAVAR